MGNKLYKPKNKRKKENMTALDKLEVGGITIAAIALLGWSGFSAVNAFIPEPEIPTHEIYVDGVADYMSNLDSDTDTEESSADEDAEVTPEATPEATPTATATPEPTKNPTKTPAPTKAPDKKKTKKSDKKEKTEAAAETTPAADAVTPAVETTAPAETTPTADIATTPAAEAAPVDTATPAAAAPAVTYIINDAVHIRTSPDKNSTSIGTTAKGETLTVLEDPTTHPGWYKISRDGAEGYVSADFVVQQ